MSGELPPDAVLGGWQSRIRPGSPPDGSVLSSAKSKLYSPESLVGAVALLADFIEKGTSPDKVRTRNRSRMDSNKRKWKITARSGASGAYDQPINWDITAADVIAGGPELYCERVTTWAKSINQMLNSLGYSKGEANPRR